MTQLSALSPRGITILGSTGSIGTQALDVIASHSDSLYVTGIAVSGAHPEQTAQQVLDFGITTVAVADEAKARDVAQAIDSCAKQRSVPSLALEIIAGDNAASDLASRTSIAGRSVDVVLNGITGSVGLGPTLAALNAGTTLALANKESLIAGGQLVLDARQRPDQIVPVDSEHSAIAQALRAGEHSEISRLLLTASGGPFRGRSEESLHGVTPEEALGHPTWSMGPVVTINSATMMNKGLEVIEASLLFGVDVDRIDVVVHPQSIVHSMVEFVDGAVIAQASPPDMRLPISLGLTWPNRLETVIPPCDWSSATQWTFEPVGEYLNIAIATAKDALRDGQSAPAIMNAANEQAVAAFLDGQIRFTDIVPTVRMVLGDIPEVSEFSGERLTLDALTQAQEWARQRADSIIETRGM